MPEIAETPQNATPDVGQTPVAPPSTLAPDGQAAQSATLESTGFRWGEKAPQWLRGKSADETLDVVGKLVTALESAAVAQNAQPQPQVEMPEQSAQAFDDDLLVTNPAEWRRRFTAQQDARTAQTLNAAGAPLAANIASIAAELAKRDSANADVASKWWGEVESLVAPIPPHLRSKELYDQAARLARSNHIDEIASERAQRLAASATGIEGVGSGGVSGAAGAAGGSSEDPAWAKIRGSELGARILSQYGKGKIEKAAAEMGGLSAYADMVAGTRTTFDANRPSIMYTELVR